LTVEARDKNPAGEQKVATCSQPNRPSIADFISTILRFFWHDDTHLINMLMPVVSMALLMPFHEATIEYFCRAVSGRRGSGADGAGGSLTLLSESFLLSPLLANFPSSHPMMPFSDLFRLHFFLRILFTSPFGRFPRWKINFATLFRRFAASPAHAQSTRPAL
jgi:hypothetical protein